MKIFKYPLELGGNVIDMPKGAEALHVGFQGQDIFIWAKVDPNAKLEPREFIIAGTGHDLPEPLGAHIGTVFVGSFVWHVFHGTSSASPSPVLGHSSESASGSAAGVGREKA